MPPWLRFACVQGSEAFALSDLDSVCSLRIAYPQASGTCWTASIGGAAENLVSLSAEESQRWLRPTGKNMLSDEAPYFANLRAI